jgi:hypothetical protein
LDIPELPFSFTSVWYPNCRYHLVDIGQSTVGVSGCWPGGKACGSPAGPSDRTNWWIALKSSSDIAFTDIGRSLSGV